MMLLCTRAVSKGLYDAIVHKDSILGTLLCCCAQNQYQSDFMVLLCTRAISYGFYDPSVHKGNFKGTVHFLNMCVIM